jgi:hypothetical protein
MNTTARSIGTRDVKDEATRNLRTTRLRTQFRNMAPIVSSLAHASNPSSKLFVLND